MVGSASATTHPLGLQGYGMWGAGALGLIEFVRFRLMGLTICKVHRAYSRLGGDLQALQDS